MTEILKRDSNHTPVQSTTEFLIEHALDIISDTYGDTASVVSKKKDLLKFGRNQNVGSASTGYTIWFTGADQAHETYVFRNLIDSVSSGSTSDTAFNVTIEGHAVGDDISVSSITQTGGTATVTTSTAHGFVADEWVYVEGANEAGYNGVVKVASVPSITTFTYTVASGTDSPATGTITVTSQNKTFVTQTVAINGQTRVPLTTSIARMTRMFIPEQNKAVANVGALYGYENTSLTSGKPTDTTKIHITVPAGKSQSEKASTSLSNTDYWIITSFRGSMLEKAASFADVELQVRRNGGVFRPIEDVSCSDAHTGIFQFKPYAIIPKNADVRLVAISDSTSRDVSGSIQGFLATTNV